MVISSSLTSPKPSLTSPKPSLTSKKSTSNQKIILIIIIILLITGLAIGGYFLYKYLFKKGPKGPNGTETPSGPTGSDNPSGPTGTDTPISPTGSSPEKKCSDTLPTSFDICYHNEGDIVNILKCVQGEFISYQPQTIKEVEDFCQTYYQKSFTEKCSQGIDCKGTASLVQGDKDVKYTCQCSNQPPNEICDVCAGNTWVCKQGEYVCESPSNCGDLIVPDNKSFTEYCSNKGGCENGIATCVQQGNTININCKKNCPTDKGLINLACKDCNGENQICVCDESTLDKFGNQTWTCKEQIPLSSGCPPKPENVSCKDDLKCISCSIGQDSGYIWYCPGNEVPVNCLVNAFGLTSNTIDGSPKDIWIASKDNNEPPVFPTIDNDSCLQTAFENSNCGNPKPFTSLLNTPFSNIVDQWSLLQNPAGILYKGSSEKERGNYKPYSGEYLVNNYCFSKTKSNFNQKKDMTNTCVWTKDNSINPRPDCNEINGGVFAQDCLDKDGNKVKCPNPSSDDYNNFYKLGSGACDCSNTVVDGDPTNKYTGDKCQYSDKFTCNNNGKAQFDGSCVCNSGFAGDKCQLSREKNCNNKGNPQADGSCICDKDFGGRNCQFTRENRCNNAGVPDKDGNCVCDNQNKLGIDEGDYYNSRPFSEQLCLHDKNTPVYFKFSCFDSDMCYGPKPLETVRGDTFDNPSMCGPIVDCYTVTTCQAGPC